MDLGHLNVRGLKAISKHFKLEGYNTMKRVELLELINKHLEKNKEQPKNAINQFLNI
jgi:hypothetical protein